MIETSQIEAAVRTLAETAHPDRILLFGSYARGDADDDSDLEFLVIESGVEDRAGEMVRLEERRQVNEGLGDLARHLNEPRYNPDRLDFKALKVPHGPWTYQCDAWSKGGAKRLFGYFEEGNVFVVDALDEGLH